jgi:protein tyrosine phosphatase
VRLRQRGAVATPDGADYINANLLEYPLPGVISRKYIATQGPLRSTSHDFWTMVWEQQVGVIVMLTELVDQFGREACAQYWPTEGTMDIGEYTVRALSTQKLADFDLARLELLEKHTSEVHIVVHVLYHAWPDYEVPASPESVLCLHACISSMQVDTGDAHPLLVHCTAGLGRTGAYILIDILLRLITMNVGVPNAEAALLVLREQRRGLVQTEDQYAFALRVAIAYLDKELKSASS